MKNKKCEHDPVYTGDTARCCKCGYIYKRKPKHADYNLEKLPAEWRLGGKQ